MKDVDILFSTVAMENDTNLVQTQFGKFQKGCVLSYPQKMSSDQARSCPYAKNQLLAHHFGQKNVFC